MKGVTIIIVLVVLTALLQLAWESLGVWWLPSFGVTIAIAYYAGQAEGEGRL